MHAGVRYRVVKYTAIISLVAYALISNTGLSSAGNNVSIIGTKNDGNITITQTDRDTPNPTTSEPIEAPGSDDNASKNNMIAARLGAFTAIISLVVVILRCLKKKHKHTDKIKKDKGREQ